ncbi:MFS transporter [Pararhodobacter sp. CCB-MM2]|uniref:MFS transporter n=1 Tax=Pararhodobacter sp. CCB-MM2 TaxID=1786003 RepID=UPI00082B561B|nr:MFS transporter [Pararhodobacter sp. CCB-MM2]
MSILPQLRASRGPLACFVGMGLVWGSFMAAMPDVKAGLGVSDGTMGLLLIWGSVAAITMMSLTPLFGSALGRAALPGFGLLMGVSLAVMGLAEGPLPFVLALMGMGMASGALDVLMNARLSAIEAQRGESLMSLNHGLYSLGFAAAAVLTGVARAAGWSVTAILGTGALAVVVLALMAYERDGRIEGLERARGRERVALGLAPLLGGALILAGLMAENAVEAWSALFVERELGGALGAGSLAPALMAVTMGFGRLTAQAFGHRMRQRWLLSGGLAVALAGVVVVASAVSPGWAYLGFAVMGLGASVVVPTTLVLIGRATTHETRSRAIARATVLGYLGYFMGPPVLGLVAEHAGLRLSFGLIALILALAALAIPPLVKRA